MFTLVNKSLRLCDSSCVLQCTAGLGIRAGEIYSEDVTGVTDNRGINHHLFADDKQRFAVAVTDVNVATIPRTCRKSVSEMSRHGARLVGFS